MPAPTTSPRPSNDDVSRAPLCAGCAYSQLILPVRRPKRGPLTKCDHPRTAAAHAARTPLQQGVIELTGALPVEIVGITVTADPEAVAHGWFAWPFAFDAAWLVSCDGVAAPAGAPAGVSPDV